MDSAGTHSYHVGEAPDSRSIAAARTRGVDIGNLRARKVRAADFHDFDYILALDQGHLELLQRMLPSNAKAQLSLFHTGDVPDPYYGSARDFEHVLDLVEIATDAWITKLKAGL